MTTSAHYVQNRALEELAEQIIAVANALDVVRENYLRQRKQEESAPVPVPVTTNSKTSSWSSKAPARTSEERVISPLGPKQHPLVLSIWASSYSDDSYQRALASSLSSLIVEKRKYSRDLELGKNEESEKQK
ncbi:hypothetical protein BGZ49_008820 [Haplosporangium sp. Z 27]|nr:hypothetical protein BGZ49_008820 [Haplosporangium sp. Z 27]